MSIHLDQTVIEFITVTRGGGDGLMAIVEINAEAKYFELIGLESLLKKYPEDFQQKQLNKAIFAIQSVDDLDDIVEFEGGLPVQGSLF